MGPTQTPRTTRAAIDAWLTTLDWLDAVHDVEAERGEPVLVRAAERRADREAAPIRTPLAKVVVPLP